MKFYSTGGVAKSLGSSSCSFSSVGYCASSIIVSLIWFVTTYYANCSKIRGTTFSTFWYDSEDTGASSCTIGWYAFGPITWESSSSKFMFTFSWVSKKSFVSAWNSCF